MHRALLGSVSHGLPLLAHYSFTHTFQWGQADPSSKQLAFLLTVFCCSWPSNYWELGGDIDFLVPRRHYGRCRCWLLPFGRLQPISQLPRGSCAYGERPIPFSTQASEWLPGQLMPVLKRSDGSEGRCAYQAVMNKCSNFFLTIVPYSLLLESVRKPNSTIGCASQEYVPRSGRGNGHFCSRALSRSTRRRPSPTLHSSVPCPSTPSCIIDDCSEAVNS